MNFDANTLSTLMQMLSAQKSSVGENRKNEDSYNGNSGYSDYSGNSRCDGYNDPRYRNSNGYNGADKVSVQSVFAMQNGLGEKAELFGQQEQKKEQSAPNNPMSALLEMLTGKSAGSADMMSSIMPMLMNMMSGRTKPAQAAQASPAQSQNTSPKADEKSNTKNEDTNTHASADKEENSDKCNFKESSTHTKTQPIRRDKFEPIAFAGYTLISALNKLYISKRAKR